MERKQTALRAVAIFGLLVLLGGTSSHAQEPKKTEAASEPAAAEPAAAETTPAEPQPSAPIFGMDTTGTLDIGYRWNAGLRGNQDMYRTLVNLGEGPRLLGANLTMNSPLGAGKYVDRIQLNASAWGGDPYNTLRLFAEKSKAYQFTFDYRKVDYFNFIPTFANPLLGQGILLGQHSFDSTRRTMDFDLTLRPGATVSPFLAYSRNSGFGPGVTTFTGDGNEFAVRNQLRDTSDYYRGGVVFNLARASLTLEQGILAFKDDQRISQSGGTNLGNRRTPVLGQTVVLNQLDENYHARGTTPVSRIQLTATPWDKLTVAGRFVYSQPDLDFDYDRRTVGNFVSTELLRVYTGELASGTAEATRPHILGNLSVEFRPWERVRILESWLTDRFHIASTSALGRSLTGIGALGPVDPNERLALNTSQNQLEGVVDLTSRLSVRGGYRYVWSDTELFSQVENSTQAISLNRHVGLAGFGFRLPRRVDVSLDFEAGEGNQVYSRTDVLDYRKTRLRGRYQPWEIVTVSGAISLLDHENTRPDLDYDFQNHGYTVSVNVAPEGGKRVSANLEYSRSDLSSDILYLIPQLFASDRSVYIEDSHYGGLSLDVGIIRDIRLRVGYNVLSTSGSRPLNYHQPNAGIVIPLNRRVAWTTDWRYFGYNERGQTLQDFHNHLITAGLRFSY